MDVSFRRKFKEYEASFYQYMVTTNSPASRAKKDYITRLRFLSDYYLINEDISEEKIAEILENERIAKNYRNTYNKEKSIGDFSAALKKFLAFVNHQKEYPSDAQIQNEIAIVERLSTISDTEKETIVKARIGQGPYRRRLIDYWEKCSFSGCDMTSLLVASHIKPWKDSNNTERIDIYNGLLLLPNYDKLFDSGYITVDTLGNILFSDLLPNDIKVLLGMTNLPTIPIEEPHKKYLEYHNINRFMR